MQNCYQFSGGTSIPENADMKSSQYLIPGNYYCNSINVALTLSNCPLNSAFLLKVEWSVGENARYIRQTFKQYDNNKIISRVYFNDASEWKDETEYITNADLAQPFLPLGADNNHWGGFDITISNNEYLRFQINSSGRIELVRYTNNSLNGVKVISDIGWT